MLVRAFLALIVLVFIIGYFDIPIWPKSKWGFIDRRGNLVIPANFDRVQGIGKGNLVYTCEPQQSFHQGLAAVAIGDLWGFIDKGGKIVIKPQFDAVGDFSEGLACVQSHDRCGFIDHSGKLVIALQYSPHALNCKWMIFKDGLAAVELDNHSMGFINKSGKYVVKPELRYAWPFSEGRAIVFRRSGTETALIDTSGKIVFGPQGARLEGKFSDGLVLVRKQTAQQWPNQPCWYVDGTGKQMTKELTGRAYDFSEGLAAINLGTDKYGYINRKGDVVIKLDFDKAGDFHEGLAAVGIQHPDKDSAYRYKWGYIDKTGAWVVPPQYDDAGTFSAGLATVRLNSNPNGLYTSKEGCIDKHGNIVIPIKYGSVFPFSEGLAAVQ